MAGANAIANGGLHREPMQLALALDHAESHAREDFLEGPSNAAALALIERWPDWPSRTVLLRGPDGSGKTHLAAIWAREAGARTLSPRYIACGPVWPTLTKAMPWIAQGLDNLAWWCRMAGVPVVAIATRVIPI